jgi:ribose transport system permease protein
MLPFAAILAIAAAGQTLVIQQGGIDLSVPGLMSISVVFMTHYPAGDDGKILAAALIAYGVALAAGLLTGFLVSRIGITAIVTTLGVNALLFGWNIDFGGGSSRTTTDGLHDFTSSSVLGVPTPVVIALAIVGIVSLIVKRTVVGRRFEAVGANPVAARAAGIEPTRYQIGGYVGATLLYCTAGVLLAGVVTTPSAFQGNSYLLPSVAAVVLGGTSLLGGVGSVFATAVAALFLSQLDQLILTTGVSGSVTYLVQAGALAAGILIYSVRWGRMKEFVRDAVRPRRRAATS